MKKFDEQFRNEKIKLVAGVDEAGRGPLAGPVVAAAVIFPRDLDIPGINDSKKLTEKKREELFEVILEKSLSHGIGIINHEEIDKINILQASLKAMKIAVEKLNPLPDMVLIDGNKTFSTNLNVKAIVKGDGKSMAIAGASILAKVTRDRLMKELALTYPEYMWEQNKGYPTKAHIELIKQHGITPYHRKTFLGNIFPDPEQMLEFKS